MNRTPMRRETIRIAMIEDDPLRLVGFHSLLDPVPDFNLSRMSVQAFVQSQGMNLALIGNHSGLKFFDAMASMTSAHPNVRVVVTGSNTDAEAIFKAIAAGAKGYVSEDAPARELIRAIYAVHGGSVWAPRTVISLFIDRSGSLPHTQQCRWALTSRERQVLRMLVEGRSNKEIGAPLGIEERTVKAHVAKMMRKVGVRNRIALTVHAISHSLLSAQCS